MVSVTGPAEVRSKKAKPPTSSPVAMSLTIFSSEKGFLDKNCYYNNYFSLNYTSQRGSTKR